MRALLAPTASPTCLRHAHTCHAFICLARGMHTPGVCTAGWQAGKPLPRPPRHAHHGWHTRLRACACMCGHVRPCAAMCGRTCACRREAAGRAGHGARAARHGRAGHGRRRGRHRAQHARGGGGPGAGGHGAGGAGRHAAHGAHGAHAHAAEQPTAGSTAWAHGPQHSASVALLDDMHACMPTPLCACPYPCMHAALPQRAMDASGICKAREVCTAHTSLLACNCRAWRCSLAPCWCPAAARRMWRWQRWSAGSVPPCPPRRPPPRAARYPPWVHLPKQAAPVPKRRFAGTLQE